VPCKQHIKQGMQCVTFYLPKQLPGQTPWATLCRPLGWMRVQACVFSIPTKENVKESILRWRNVSFHLAVLFKR
jgi:hypothetical protein